MFSVPRPKRMNQQRRQPKLLSQKYLISHIWTPPTRISQILQKTGHSHWWHQHVSDPEQIFAIIFFLSKWALNVPFRYNSFAYVPRKRTLWPLVLVSGHCEHSIYVLDPNNDRYLLVKKRDFLYFFRRTSSIFFQTMIYREPYLGHCLSLVLLM